MTEVFQERITKNHIQTAFNNTQSTQVMEKYFREFTGIRSILEKRPDLFTVIQKKFATFNRIQSGRNLIQVEKNVKYILKTINILLNSAVESGSISKNTETNTFQIGESEWETVSGRNIENTEKEHLLAEIDGLIHILEEVKAEVGKKRKAQIKIEKDKKAPPSSSLVFPKNCKDTEKILLEKLFKEGTITDFSKRGNYILTTGENLVLHNFEHNGQIMEHIESGNITFVLFERSERIRSFKGSELKFKELEGLHSGTFQLINKNTLRIVDLEGEEKVYSMAGAN